MATCIASQPAVTLSQSNMAGFPDRVGTADQGRGEPSSLCYCFAAVAAATTASIRSEQCWCDEVEMVMLVVVPPLLPICVRGRVRMRVRG